MIAISSQSKWGLLAGALWAGLVLSPVRTMLESGMALHMVVQLPLLAVVGVLLSVVLCPIEPRRLTDVDWLGLPGLTLALFAMSYWMLPRSLDSALADPGVEFAKFLSVPLLIGLPLASSWQRLPLLGRDFVLAHFVSLLGTIGGLYLGVPIRLCAYYRLDQQIVTGWSLIAIAAALTVSSFLAAFFGRVHVESRPTKASTTGLFTGANVHG